MPILPGIEKVLVKKQNKHLYMKNLIQIKNTKIFGKVYSKFIKHFFGINNYLRNSKTTTRRRHHTTTVIRKPPQLLDRKLWKITWKWKIKIYTQFPEKSVWADTVNKGAYPIISIFHFKIFQDYFNYLPN